uniref:Uncharacterized protein n=1 Tax=Oryza punctata TaxID=4537 RepID=A0A0E0KJU9_ORYPU
MAPAAAIMFMDGAFASCAFNMNSRKGRYPSPSSVSCSGSWRQWRAQLVMKRTMVKESECFNIGICQVTLGTALKYLEFSRCFLALI